jgi:hypothetical protein
VKGNQAAFAEVPEPLKTVLCQRHGKKLKIHLCMNRAYQYVHDLAGKSGLFQGLVVCDLQVDSSQ